MAAVFQRNDGEIMTGDTGEQPEPPGWMRCVPQSPHGAPATVAPDRCSLLRIPLQGYGRNSRPRDRLAAGVRRDPLVGA